MLLCPFCLCLMKNHIFLDFPLPSPKVVPSQTMTEWGPSHVCWLSGMSDLGHSILSRVLAKVVLMGICKSVTKLDDQVHSVGWQGSTRYLLWWVRHTFPTDLTYFQLCLLFNNAFFFLSFPLVLLYLSLPPCCFNCWFFCFQNSLFGFFPAGIII